MERACWCRILRPNVERDFRHEVNNAGGDGIKLANNTGKQFYGHGDDDDQQCRAGRHQPDRVGTGKRSTVNFGAVESINGFGTNNAGIDFAGAVMSRRALG